jgi:hypothetical protein
MNLLLFSLQEQTATQIRTPGSSSSSISMSASLWSGNLRLSLVLIPVKLHSAVSTEEAISFRMIHEPSGQPIRYVKGIETEKGFEEVPEEEIVKATSTPKVITSCSDPKSWTSSGSRQSTPSTWFVRRRIRHRLSLLGGALLRDARW